MGNIEKPGANNDLKNGTSTLVHIHIFCFVVGSWNMIFKESLSKKNQNIWDVNALCRSPPESEKGQGSVFLLL